MSLSPGARVGHYEVLALVGSGGMGQVYRARDARLNRDVALKILPDAFTDDPERRARFEREAQLLAALSHPHIATLHGLEAVDGSDCLVMEFVPGLTLADRLEGGPLSVAEALPLFAQIAAAVEAAHEKGIVHRDLKPGNIKITPDGRAKVLDFGLAKSVLTEPAPDMSSQATTALSPATAIGAVTGTAAYMSPEQARGLPVDRRTDVWAFGCVCYEALSGRAAFSGSTLTDVLATVTRADPDWSAIHHAPQRIQELIRRCLRKDRERRLQSIADARIEIEDAIADATTPEPAVHTAGGRPRWLVVAIVGAVALVAGAVLALRLLSGPGPAPTIQAAIEIPPRAIGVFSGLVLSPDGRTIVYGGDIDGGQLFRRRMDVAAAEAIPGAETAYHPFLSPDGAWIGFFDRGRLKKIPIAGGLAQDVSTLVFSGHSHGSWGRDDTIVFVQGARQGLWRVPASGGTPEQLATPDAARNEKEFLDPSFLPDGRAILFTVRTDSGVAIAILVPSTGERRLLVDGGRFPWYSPTGHLVFWQDFALRAAPLDPARLTLTGPPVTVVSHVSALGGWGPAFSSSRTGTLVYYPAFEDKSQRTLTWIDRAGAVTPVVESRQSMYVAPRLSPDGRQALVRFEGLVDCSFNTLDLARGSWSRLTFLGDSHSAAWSPDGTRVAFQSERAVGNTILIVPAGGGPEQTVFVSAHDIGAIAWSPDGDHIAFSQNVPDRGHDLFWIRATGGVPQPLLQTPFNEREPEFSPDGRWVAYTSDESGRREVYVRPFPGPGSRTVISVNGGETPRWTRGGRELLYRTQEGVMSVAVDTARGFAAAKPQRVFAGPAYPDGGYDVTADGKRLLVVQSKATPASTQIQVVLNWFSELKARVPSR
ncbi:MAG TPA: protein kinase [Vicinamibacterales bacterium]|nr:protein kinase [Vicinamibacterales bacterium]